MHVLHGHEVGVSQTTEFVNLNDVGVRDKRTNLRLIDEHLHELRIPRQLGQYSFDDQDALEPLGPAGHGAKYLGHATLTNALQQHVASVAFSLVVGGFRSVHEITTLTDFATSREAANWPHAPTSAFKPFLVPPMTLLVSICSHAKLPGFAKIA